MNRKLLAVTVLALVLSACGGDPNQSDEASASDALAAPVTLTLAITGVANDASPTASWASGVATFSCLPYYTGKKCTATIPAGVDLTVSFTAPTDSLSGIAYQRPYCEVSANMAYCNAMLAADPNWYPKPTMAYSAEPLVIKAISTSRTIGAKYTTLPPPPCVPNQTATPRFVDNGNLTVTDRWSCLMWEKKTGTFDPSGYSANYLDPHNVNNTYQFVADGTTNSTVEAFLSKLNNSYFGGYNDWRLPNESIADPTGYDFVVGTPGDTVNEWSGIFSGSALGGPNAVSFYWTGSPPPYAGFQWVYYDGALSYAWSSWRYNVRAVRKIP